MTDTDRTASDILAGGEVHTFGFCRFEDTLPLLPCRAASRIPEGARSVMVCLLGYWVGDIPRNVAAYAVADDYHLVAEELFSPVLEGLRRAFPGRRFAFFTDSSPIREVFAAYQAGLGFIGKNGQLIRPGAGSRHFICEIVTDLELTPAQPLSRSCGSCNACVAACPGGAILPGGRIEAGRCRSHISQKKGELTSWERESLRRGGLAWGCDICTDACPYNRVPVKTDIARFYQETTGILSEENCTEMASRKAFGWRGEKVLRRNLAILAEKAAEPAVPERQERDT